MHPLPPEHQVKLPPQDVIIVPQQGYIFINWNSPFCENYYQEFSLIIECVAEEGATDRDWY